MLKIEVMNLGIYMVNCYIIREAEAKSCCVIDPGGNPEKVLKYLADEGLTLEAILLTHCHFDHVGAVKALAEETGCRVYISEADLSLPEKLTAGKIFYTHTYEKDLPLTAAGLSFRVIHTPGHTPGSVCLLTEDAIFSGDTLFARSCGRTDLAGGDQNAMQESLGILAALEGDWRVFPGHSRATTLALEKEYNPFMKRK